MKLIIKYFILALVGFTNLHAQVNLVPNGSFENLINCPSSTSQFEGFVVSWFNPNLGSPDLYNSCASPNNISDIPNNLTGNILPFDGNGFCGIYLLKGLQNDPGNKSREYIGVHLVNSLVKDSLYSLKFYTSLAIFSNIAISNIGCLISKDSIYQFNFLPLYTDSSIFSSNNINNIINNKNSWTELTFNFKANGGEKYLYIGDFNNDSLTNYLNLDDTISNLFEVYYLFDKISLTRTNEVGIEENTIKSQIKLYPNPSTNNVFIELPPQIKNAKALLISSSGAHISAFNLTGGINELSLSQYPNGLYFIRILSVNGNAIDTKRIALIR